MKTPQNQIPLELINCLKTYSENDFATFPTRDDKKPEHNCFWKESKIDSLPSVSKYPNGQFGVVLRPDDLVIDIDPRNMKSRQVWSELKQFVPDLIPIEKQATLVQTGNGGIHIYLQKPQNFPIKKSLSQFPGIDFLTTGSYVIGAGSIVQSRPYIFLNVPFTRKINAPIALLNLISKTMVATNSNSIKEKIPFNDSKENIEIFSTYLKSFAPIAISGENGNDTTYQVACKGRDQNLSEDTTLSLMLKHYNRRCIPVWSEKELTDIIRHTYLYAKGVSGLNDPKLSFSEEIPDPISHDQDWVVHLAKTKFGNIKTTLRNCILLLTHEIGIRGLFRFNEFSKQLEIHGRVPWENSRKNIYNNIDDREIECIKIYLDEKFRIEFPTTVVYRAIDLVGAGNSYHPIQDEIKSYTWDKKERIDYWLQTYCGVADSEIVRMFSRKVLVAMIERVFNPGCKFDYVLVLEGKQGIGKSTACKILGGDWYGDAPIDPKDKDCIPYIHSHWLIELSEMITTRKTEVDQLKNFISRTEDDVRLPYERTRKRFPRQCVFIGTINPEASGYLNDTTGNRRYWSVYCSKINISELKRDRDQLFAEALIKYQNKEPLYLPQQFNMELIENAKTRQTIDPWGVAIMDWVQKNPSVSKLTTSEIFTAVLGGSLNTMHTGHHKRISNILKDCKWGKKRTSAGMVYTKPINVKDGVGE